MSNYPADRTLESIYERMNIGEKPDGYTGHSLSMSDVIVTNIDGEEKAYYCDDVGFTEMPEFFREKEIIAEKSPIIEEFRAKTEEMFHAVPTNYDDFNPSVDAIERAARNYIDFVLQENDLQDEITINDVIISGSRCRGLETDNSDLDIVIEYESDSYREDAFFNLLNDTEVNDNADFSDLSKVDLAYTNDEDNGLEIQVSADLEQYRMIFAYDGNTVREEQYESLADMNENALSVLDYGDLISLSEDEKTPVIAESIGVEDDFSDIDTQQIRENLENTAPEESPFVQQVQADVDSIDDDDAPLFADSSVYEKIEKAEKADTPSFENTYGEQIALFGFEDMSFEKPKKQREFKVPELKQADISGINTLDELKKEIKRGSGFENGKFRIQKFYEENKPNNKEFADLLKHEYGIGGHSANDPIAFVDHDSKGIQFILNDENGRMSDTKFTFTWTEAAKMASDLIDKGEYLSEKQAEQYIEWKNPVKEDVAVDEIVADSHEEEIIEPETVKADEPVPTEKADNFVITDDSLGEGGAKTKFKNNISAIETLKTLESENRPATKEEMETLSKYVGWGGIPQAFDKDNEAWSNEYSQLKDLLIPQEYRQANASVLDAFYTSPVVIERQNGYKSVFK